MKQGCAEQRGPNLVLILMLLTFFDRWRVRARSEIEAKRRRKVLLEPPTEGRIALTAYFLPGLADWFLDVRRKRYLLSTRRRIQVLLTVHWSYLVLQTGQVG